MLSESQQRRLITRWNKYLEAQMASGDNQYGSASGQMAVLRRYYPSPPASVLFVGCGDGLEVHEARAAGYEAEGVTLGQPDVDRAQRVYGLQLTRCDAHFLPDEWENRFDFVGGFQVLEHSISGFLFIWEMGRVLKPGGRFYVEVPHPNFVLDHHWHHIGSPTPEQMKGWMLKLSCANIETGYIDNLPDAAHWAFGTATKG